MIENEGNFELIEISDSEVLAEIQKQISNSFDLELKNLNDSLLTFNSENNQIALQQGIGAIVQKATSTGLGKAVEAGTKTVSENGGKLLVAYEKNGNVITDTSKLFSSRQVQGAFTSGIKNSKGAVGGQVVLKEAAGLTEVASKGAKVAKVAGASMQVASVVVGQYYMSEISNKLSDISGAINKVASYQQSNILSQLQTANDELQILSTYKNELFKNGLIRNNNLQKIDRIKHDLAILNNQATNRLETIAANGIDSEQKAISDIKELSEWHFVAVSSENLLILASELEYLFGQGILTKNYSDDLLKTVQARFVNADEKVNLYFDQLSENFKLTDRAKEQRDKKNEKILEKVDVNVGLPFLNFKLGEIKVDKHIRGFAKVAKNFVDERVDYGLNFGMSDSKVQNEIVKPIQQIRESIPMSSPLEEMKKALSAETQILIGADGKYYHVRAESRSDDD